MEYHDEDHRREMLKYRGMYVDQDRYVVILYVKIFYVINDLRWQRSCCTRVRGEPRPFTEEREGHILMYSGHNSYVVLLLIAFNSVVS